MEKKQEERIERQKNELDMSICVYTGDGNAWISYCSNYKRQGCMESCQYAIRQGKLEKVAGNHLNRFNIWGI